MVLNDTLQLIVGALDFGLEAAAVLFAAKSLPRQATGKKEDEPPPVAELRTLNVLCATFRATARREEGMRLDFPSTLALTKELVTALERTNSDEPTDGRRSHRGVRSLLASELPFSFPAVDFFDVPSTPAPVRLVLRSRSMKKALSELLSVFPRVDDGCLTLNETLRQMVGALSFGLEAVAVFFTTDEDVAELRTLEALCVAFRATICREEEANFGFCNTFALTKELFVSMRKTDLDEPVDGVPHKGV